MFLSSLYEKAQTGENSKINHKRSGVIHADLNSSKGRGKLLFVSPKCTVVELHNLPYMLFTTSDFSEEILPLNIKRNIYEVKEIVLQPSFSTEAHKLIKYCTIPKWLTNFKKIESLRFEYVELDDLNCLSNLPVQYLTFENIKYDDCQKLIGAIKQFKHLKKISYDRSFSTELIQHLEKLNLKLTPVIAYN